MDGVEEFVRLQLEISSVSSVCCKESTVARSSSNSGSKGSCYSCTKNEKANRTFVGREKTGPEVDFF